MATVAMTEQSTSLLPAADEEPSKDHLPRGHRRNVSSVSYTKRSGNLMKLRQTLPHILRPNPARISKGLRRLGYAFLPQPLRSTLYGDYAPVERKRPTSWLDGMRGYAAIIIFNFHFFCAFTDMSQKPWGDEKHRYFIELPVIRVLHSQMPPYIFFMAAGYALSIKPLQLMRANDQTKLLQVLSGSAFRRIIRLMIPTLAIMLITSLMAYVGFFETFRPIIEDPRKAYRDHPGKAKKVPQQYDNLYDQLHLIREELSALLNFFTWRRFYPRINGALWTIRVELRGSIMMYAALLVLARAKEYVRLVCMLGCMFYCFQWEKMMEVSYFWGAIVAQLTVMREPRGEKSGLLDYEHAKAESPFSQRLARYRPLLTEMQTSRKLHFRFLRWCFTVSCIAGPFYLMTCPMNNSEEAPGYKFLTRMMPAVLKDRAESISLLGNCILVWIYSYSIQGSALWTAFSNDFALYLGRNMFGIYLIHSPMMDLFGYALPHVFWDWMSAWGSPKDDLSVYVVGLAAGWFLTAIPTLLLADVFTRELIQKAFMAAFWAEKVCYAKTG